MLFAFVSRSERKPTWLQLQHCILRNFGGLENIKPVDIFCKKLIVDRYEQVLNKSYGQFFFKLIDLLAFYTSRNFYS